MKSRLECPLFGLDLWAGEPSHILKIYGLGSNFALKNCGLKSPVLSFKISGLENLEFEIRCNLL